MGYTCVATRYRRNTLRSACTIPDMPSGSSTRVSWLETPPNAYDMHSTTDRMRSRIDQQRMFCETSALLEM